MMKEVLRRRFARLAKEEEEGIAGDDSKFARSDLLLIDGGAGQVGRGPGGAWPTWGVDDIAVVGVAKGQDRDAGHGALLHPRQGAYFRLDHKSPVLYYLQRLRDEAHRFAIGTHRASRAPPP